MTNPELMAGMIVKCECGDCRAWKLRRIAIYGWLITGFIILAISVYMLAVDETRNDPRPFAWRFRSSILGSPMDIPQA